MWKRGRLGEKQLELGKYMEKPRKRYKQDWKAYNLAQTNELSLFMDTLIELIDSTITVRKPLFKNGRPFSNFKDMLFCCVMKIYFGKSFRRNNSYLALAKGKNYIDNIPDFTTVNNYYNDPALIPLFKHLIEQSGLPLKELEEQFVIDSSGFSTSLFDRWFDYRLKRNKNIRKWKKAHITSGAKTNIITAINVTEGYSADSPEFENLIRKTAQNYEMKEVSADAGYFARRNFEIVSSVGAIPYIMFRSNASGKARGSLVYKRMYEYFTKYKEDFLEHYHKRSNAESIHSAIKRKFGTHLYCKSEIGQINEILCLCLCHNICVLIQELFESNTILDFENCEKIIVRGYSSD